MIGLLKATGVIEVNKARLEAQGYKQEHRINYNAILPWKKKMIAVKSCSPRQLYKINYGETSASIEKDDHA